MEIFPTEYKIYDDDDLIATVESYDEKSVEITIHVPVDLFFWDILSEKISKCIGNLNHE